MPRLRVLILLSLATLLTAAVYAEGVNPARPGTLNYIEGSASINGRAITSNSVGTAELNAGDTLATANGKAEVLLTPGVFMRVGEDSTIKMISPELTHTEVQLTRGNAEVEVDQLYKQNDIQIDEQHGQAVLGKDGLYAFNANDNTMQVFDGEAKAYEGNSPSNEVNGIEVKTGRELVLDGVPTKTTKFDKDVASNDELYKWSSLRSDYLGDANEKLAEQYAWSYPGYGPFAAGWMWDPAFYSYTWLPGDGLFWSPYGYGFYSPFYLYGGGFIYGRGGGYFPYHGVYGVRGGAAYAGPRPSAGVRAGGFGGGFHGGGGGRR